MALTLITAGSQAVTLAEAKVQVKVDADFTTEDALITSYILTAQEHVESVLGRPMSPEVWEQTLDGFPCGAISVLKRPVTALASVKYDVDGVETTLDPADYRVDLVGGRVWSPNSWPTADDIASVRVRFTAGYTAIPARAKSAILLLVGDLYANRESKQATDLTDNPTVNNLLFTLRWSW